MLHRRRGRTRQRLRRLRRRLVRAGPRQADRRAVPDGFWQPVRHSGASLMLAQGTPLHVVSEVLGHASIAITKDIYGHLLEGDRRAATEPSPAPCWGIRPRWLPRWLPMMPKTPVEDRKAEGP
ncbi:tyrosine-type recombinase/integrase [Nonomuraea indica]|uniref:Tyrosine-type recombinase/integrase n=1 Tax=Nonomuraea indica TaxID=1581193 RepID=A0ABW8A269_9ACTN